MTSFIRIIISSLIMLSATQLYAQNKLKDVAKDHPMLSRYPGTAITFRHDSEFEGFFVAAAKLKPFGYNRKALPPGLRLKNMNVTTIEYQAQTLEPSVTRIFRNYQQAFQRLGLKKYFTCRNDSECGNKFVVQTYWYGNPDRQSKYRKLNAPNTHGTRSNYIYWSGYGVVNNRTYYITLLVSRYWAKTPVVVTLDIAQSTGPIKTDLIKVDLKKLTESIELTGKVVLGGILFDTNKTTLKSQSMEVIKTIATYLKKNPSRNFYVVGHTDSDGGYNANMQLSTGRAQAVVQELAKQGINTSRIYPVGVGPVSPVSRNSSKGNKARNRRVELVER